MHPTYRMFFSFFLLFLFEEKVWQEVHFSDPATYFYQLKNTVMMLC